jgi:hypothetical protein
MFVSSSVAGGQSQNVAHPAENALDDGGYLPTTGQPGQAEGDAVQVRGDA